MGNCLVLEEKVIRIMKTDGKILEYGAPVRVQQILADFSGHALSESLSGFHHLQPEAKLLSGKLYYLVPVLSSSQKSKKKKVRFSNPEVNDEMEKEKSGVVRIKLIISKQELQELLKKGALVHDMVSQIQSKQQGGIAGADISDHSGNNNSRGWKPVLESIAEVD